MVDFFAGPSTIQIDLGYGRDVITVDSAGDTLQYLVTARQEATTGVQYIDYSIPIDLGSIDVQTDTEYSLWRQVSVGDHVMLDPELSFVADEGGNVVVSMIEGDRYYVAYDFDTDPAKSRAISDKAKRCQIIRANTGETIIRDYFPDFENAPIVGDGGSCRILNDSYFIIPSQLQKEDARVTITKESMPLKSLISTQGVKYNTSGIGCELELSLATIEAENIGKIFDVKISEDNSLVTPRKRIGLTDGDINSALLPSRVVRVLPERIIEPEVNTANPDTTVNPITNEDAYLKWLKGLVTFPKGVLVDANQNLQYSPQEQREQTLKINCTPDEFGNRLYFGNTY